MAAISPNSIRHNDEVRPVVEKAVAVDPVETWVRLICLHLSVGEPA